MMKRLSIFIYVLVSLLLVSCGSKGETASEVESESFIEGVEIKNETYGSNREDYSDDETYEEPVFNIMKIANKGERAVEEVLGTPEKVEDEDFIYIDSGEHATNCRKGNYIKEDLDIDVWFVEGSARKILIKDTGLDNGGYIPKNALNKIGLDEKPYTSRYRNNVCWQNVYVLYEISTEEDTMTGEVHTTIITDERFR